MTFLPIDICADSAEGIFGRYSWFYALCREQLFTDHTEEIAHSMVPLLCRKRRPLLLEVGCGPGFYSYRLAKRFPHVDVVGIDPSERLLRRAKHRAQREALENCRFVRARAHQLGDFPEEADFIIASRLFLILSNRRAVLEAIYVALRPSGLLFVAEPLSPLRAALPLTCMRILQALAGARTSPRDFAQCHVLDKPQFADFVASQPWKHVRHWSDRRYQYALCEKPA
jgi:ubiquinone/menaquinone biosynthesis C-methylase UbiE